jgi:hypothetical protein
LVIENVISHPRLGNFLNAPLLPEERGWIKY